MRQELVDVSIKPQLIDKNNFHVVYSASSSANLPGSRQTVSQGPLRTVVFCLYSKGGDVQLASAPLPTHPTQPCAPHVPTPDSDTAHVFTHKNPQATCIWASTKCSRIHSGTYLVA